MNNRVKLTIRGASFYINTDESVEYTEALGRIIDERLAELLNNGLHVSMNQATVLVALEMADKFAKSEKEVNELKAQMKDYLEDSAKAKSERDYYKRELDRVRTEAKFKNDQINLFAKANSDE